MRKTVYKIYCFDCKATMVYASKARANFEATTHADLYNHDVVQDTDVITIDRFFELEGN